MKNVFILLLLASSLDLVSQDITLAEYNNILKSWQPGQVVLNDGTHLSGMIQYNHFESNIRVKLEDGIKSLLPKDFQKLTLWGSAERHFLSIPFDHYNNDTEEPTLFEILIEFDDFALMSTMSKLQAVTRQPNNIPGSVPEPLFEAGQMEYIYIFDNTGKVGKIMSIEYSESAYLFKNSKVKTRVHDTKLLQQYISGADFKDLKTFAEEHNLSFKKRNDLMSILRHYKASSKVKSK